MKPWTLISPASRGIGLALARRVLQTMNAPVVTTARKDLDQTRENILKDLPGIDEGRLKVLKMDVLGAYSIRLLLFDRIYTRFDMRTPTTRILINIILAFEYKC